MLGGELMEKGSGCGIGESGDRLVMQKEMDKQTFVLKPFMKVKPIVSGAQFMHAVSCHSFQI